jgi:hypothetical protein
LLFSIPRCRSRFTPLLKLNPVGPDLFWQAEHTFSKNILLDLT